MKERLRRWLPPPLWRMARRWARPNRWWTRLERLADGGLLPEPSAEALEACAAIRAAYPPLLEEFAVDPRQFFEGSIKDEDAATLYSMVRARQPQRVYQVGTFAGYSALVLAHALRANGRGRLVCCDPELPHRTRFDPVDLAREAAKRLGLDSWIRFGRGFHAVRTGNPYLPPTLVGNVPIAGRALLEELGSVDFAFIDGDHSTVATIADLLLLEEFLDVRGIVVFHDVFSWPTVARALTAFFEDNYYWGVGTKSRFRLDTRFGPDGLAAIEKRPRPSHGFLHIRVVSAVSRAPIPRAHVEVQEHALDARTGDDGSVLLVGGAKRGVEVRVEARGFASAVEKTQVSSRSEMRELVIELQPDPLG